MIRLIFAFILLGMTTVSAQQTRSDLDLDTIPYQGKGIGHAGPYGGNNWNTFIRTGYAGTFFQIDRTGNLDYCQFQIASNRFAIGETSKSCVLGSKEHGSFTFPLQFRIFKSNIQREIVGEPLVEVNFKVENRDGSNVDGRQLINIYLNSMHVVKGEYYLALVRNMAVNLGGNYSNDNTFCSLNMVANMGRPDFGLTPPAACGPYWGDVPIHVVSSSLTEPLLPRSSISGHNFGFSWVYTDGVERGHVGFDSSYKVHSVKVGGEKIARQIWIAGYASCCKKVALAIYRQPDECPTKNLIVRFSGSDMKSMDLIIEPNQVQIYNNVYDNFEKDHFRYAYLWFDLPRVLIQSPGESYQIELFAPGSNHDYRMLASRRYHQQKNDHREDPKPIEPNLWSSNAQFSTDNGESWNLVGWPNVGGDNLPIWMFTDGCVASTVDKLPCKKDYNN